LAFNLFDSESSGKIMLRELHACMEAFNIKIKNSQIKIQLKNLGIKLGEGITFPQFLKIISPLLGDRYSKSEINKVFQLFDLEGE